MGFITGRTFSMRKQLKSHNYITVLNNPKVIVACKLSLNQPICNLCNTLMDKGQLPESLKLAQMKLRKIITLLRK